MSIEIYNEDCLEGMKKIPSGTVDMIATDPPYCVGASSNGIKSSFSDLNLMRPFFEECFSEWQRILKEGGHCYCCTDWRTYPFLYPILLKYLAVRNLIVWDYEWIKAGNYYRPRYELIMFTTKGKSDIIIPRAEPDVWSMRCVNVTKKRWHPSEKPVELMGRMIKNSSVEGDLVVDPFTGSGTTAIAALELNRRFIGFELEEKFFKITEKRIAEALAEKRQELF